MTPYYAEGGIKIFCGDCRAVLPLLPTADTVITDPVWPNASPALIGSDRPYELLAEALEACGQITRLAIQLGCDSDPRILTAAPPALRFFRACWLEYSRPSHKGRLLYTGDVAYLFGAPPPSRPGRRLIAGRYCSTRPDAERVAVTRHRQGGCQAAAIPAPGGSSMCAGSSRDGPMALCWTRSAEAAPRLSRRRCPGCPP